MFDALVGVREGMAEVAAGFDPGLLSAADCARVVEEAATIERMAAHVKGLAARRVAETELWRRSGARSPEEDLARRTGTSVGRAREQLATARRVRQQPEVDRAAREGRLSAEQASVISDAAAADPDAERRLVAGAGRQSLAELRDTCGRVKAAATDPEERHRRLHAERRLRTFTDAEGGFNLQLRHTPQVGASILELLRPVQDRIFGEARTADRREPVEAYAADALVEVLHRSADTTTDGGTNGSSDGGSDGGGSSAPVRVASRAAKIIVRVDLDTLLRGWPIDGETCEITGIGAIPVSAVEAMLATGDPFLTAVVTRGVVVAGVAHLGRRPTDHQLTALQWRNPTCTVQTCPATRRLEIDHRVDWAHSHLTLLELLDGLCDHHHDLKTHHGWALVPGTGKRPMVSPDDPRHPHHTTTTGDPPAAAGTGPPRRAA